MVLQKINYNIVSMATSDIITALFQILLRLSQSQ